MIISNDHGLGIYCTRNCALVVTKTVWARCENFLPYDLGEGNAGVLVDIPERLNPS